MHRAMGDSHCKEADEKEHDANYRDVDMSLADPTVSDNRRGQKPHSQFRAFKAHLELQVRTLCLVRGD